MEQSQFIEVGDTITLKGRLEIYAPISGTIDVKITLPPAGSEDPEEVEDLGSAEFNFNEAGDYTIEDDIDIFEFETDTEGSFAWQVKLNYTIEAVPYTETRYAPFQVSDALPSLNFAIRNEKVVE